MPFHRFVSKMCFVHISPATCCRSYIICGFKNYKIFLSVGHSSLSRHRFTYQIKHALHKSIPFDSWSKCEQDFNTLYMSKLEKCYQMNDTQSKCCKCSIQCGISVSVDQHSDAFNVLWKWNIKMNFTQINEINGGPYFFFLSLGYCWKGWNLLDRMQYFNYFITVSWRHALHVLYVAGSRIVIHYCTISSESLQNIRILIKRHIKP